MPEAWVDFPYLSSLTRPEIPPSYLIFIDSSDGLIKAKNGRTGIIDFQNADASTVIQAAINNIAIEALGGVIFLKVKVVIIPTGLIIPSSPPITLQGEGMTATTLIYTGTGDAIVFGDNVNVCLFSGIRDLSILTRGNPTESAITGCGWQHGFIKNVRIIRDTNVLSYGIILTYAAADSAKNSYTIDIDHNYIQDVAGDAIHLINHSHDNFIHDNLFSGISGANHYAVSVDPTCCGNWILHNHADACWGGYICYGVANQFISNGAESITGTSLYIHGVAVDTIVSYNGFDPTPTVTNLSTTTHFFRNRNYVTENSVLSPAFAIDAVALVTVTIPHGLAVTPAIEDCTLTVVEDTNVDDWGYDLLKVDNVGVANVVAKVNVSVASATGGATAKLSLRVGKA